MKRAALFVSLLLVLPLTAQQSVEQKVEALLAKMTLEEKVAQLLQFTPGSPRGKQVLADGTVGCVFNLGGAANLNELQRNAMQKSRLKIPILFAHDVIHGYRTIFPIPLGMASTWDPPSAELAARVAAREASAGGIRWTFAPMVDIARDPRWGRIAEGAGEDPFLGSAFAAAYVRGFQGSDLSARDSILACAKHFAAYGAAEAGRDYNTVDMSESRLREIYLPPFKAAVDAGVYTIMTAFNTLNGVPATVNGHLLQDILRGEWNFRGFVDSDYEAIEQTIPHGTAATAQDAAIQALRAGVDMDMVDGVYLTLVDAVREGKVAVTEIDESVRRILRAKYELGLFERPYVDEARESAAMLTAENLEASRRVAQKSIVLLKNEGGLLPLSKGVKTLAVIGPLADSREDMLGSWFAHGKGEEAVGLLEAIRARVGFQTEVLHAKGTGVLEGSDQEIADAVAAARRADVVVLALGEQGKMSGEAQSRVSLDLPGRQQELLEKVMATGKPAVLIAMSGRPLTITWAAEHVPAILWPWYPGSQGGHAIADVLFGDVNPSGKLPVTFPRSVGQVPIYYNHLRTGRPATPEDKYTSKYIDSPNEPLYPFGYGLSYTTFDYSDLRVTKQGTAVKVSVNVRNSGRRAGDEIVQLYVNDPVASTARPVRELKGFRRITLTPGQSQRVEFTLTPADLQFWFNGAWNFEPGLFRLWIADQEGNFEL